MEAKQEEERSISAPLVLSQEKLEKVYRKLQSLQEQVKRLQVSRGRQEDLWAAIRSSVEMTEATVVPKWHKGRKNHLIAALIASLKIAL